MRTMNRLSFPGSTVSTMTENEYEDVYRETLLCLSELGGVGKPFVDRSGERMCEVEGVPLSDDDVLARWWGLQISGKIRCQYLAGKSMLHQSSTNRC